MDLELFARNGVFPYAAARRHGHANTDLRGAIRDNRVAVLHRGWYTTRVGADGAGSAAGLHRLRVEALAQQYAGRAVPSHWSHLLRAGLPTFGADLETVVLRRLAPGGAQKVARGLVIHPAYHRPGPAGPDCDGTDHSAAGGPDSDPTRSLALSIVLCGLSEPLGMLVPADAAVRAGRLQVHDLAKATDLLAGRRGIGPLRAALRRVDGRHESPGETRTHWVAGNLGHDLVPQFHVDGTQRHTRAGHGYTADFRLRDTPVLVEFDGKIKYEVRPGESPELARQRVMFAEKQREDRIRDLGWEVVRFTWAELGQPQQVRARLDAAVRRASARRPT